jgi:2-dehydro-3-deoxyphosphogluconate aldolase/(4S)-4-hydroxy-2-oxoglutarate aldolase
MSQTIDIHPVLRAIKQTRIVIIYRGFKPEECLEVSKILYDAGIRLFEVTMNSQDTENTIRLLGNELASDSYIGAGTVLNTDQVNVAYEAGATYIIAPNTNIDVISRTKELEMASIPGAMTPTEMELAWESGADMIKVFPINILGAEYIKQLKGPLDNVELLACGGVKIDMVEDLVKAGCGAFGIGVQLLGEGLVENKNWETLSSRANEFIQAPNYKS